MLYQSPRFLKLIAVPPLVYLISFLFFHIIRRRLLSKNTGLPDLRLLKLGRHPDQKIPGTAVICGGSIAGLLAARVCHAHFQRVLVIEAEPWVASEEGRKVDGWVRTHQRSRVMQYTSLHACQAFLYAGLKCLFPDLEEEARRSSIKVHPANPRFNLSGVPFRVPWSAFKSGLPKTMFPTRAGFETFLRRLVLDRKSYPNIEFITGTVTDVRPDPVDLSRLGKVVVRTDVSGTTREFDATLVADCTGPARAGLKWLARNGYGYAASGSYEAGKLSLDQLKISFDQKLRYSSMTFRISPEFHDRLPLPLEMRDTKPTYTFLEDSTDESITRGKGFFVILRSDGDTVVTFAGHHGTIRPQPKNLAELKEYARGLITSQEIPDWVFQTLDMLEEAEDLAAVSLLKVAPTTYVRYHLATNLPSNFVALGDSAMTINPLFGEGCTKALRCALALQTVLLRARQKHGDTIPCDLSSRFFAEEHSKTDWMWQNTRIMDYGVPTTEPLPGESLSSGKYLRWYITRLQRLALTDDHAALVMYNAITGFSTPIDALHPTLAAKVLWRALWG